MKPIDAVVIDWFIGQLTDARDGIGMMFESAKSPSAVWSDDFILGQYSDVIALDAFKPPILVPQPKASNVIECRYCGRKYPAERLDPCESCGGVL